MRRNKPKAGTVSAFCVGPAINARTERCISQLGRDGWHKVSAKNGDVMAFNGIIDWRCPECINEHRNRIRDLHQ